jgi:hypothetical protein
MRTLKLLAALFVIPALAGTAGAFGSGDKGTSGGQFLKIAPSARPAGMGEAFAGVDDDINAIYYNPAGLGTLKKVEVTGSHASMFEDLAYDYAAVSVPLLAWQKDQRPKNLYGTLAFSVANLSVSKIERRSTTETDSPSDTFGSSDFAYSLSYGISVPDTGLSLGATAKYIDQQIDSAKATAFGMDAGALYRTGRAGFAVGLRNAGSESKFNNESDPLPLTIFTGVGYKFNDNWIGSMELDQPRDNSLTAAFGTEYRHDFGSRLVGAARLGYNSRNTDAGGFSGLAFGLGLTYNAFTFDFALVPFGDLGNTYKYSIGARF